MRMENVKILCRKPVGKEVKSASLLSVSVSGMTIRSSMLQMSSW